VPPLRLPPRVARFQLPIIQVLIGRACY
jgi:hypothetical protein